MAIGVASQIKPTPQVMGMQELLANPNFDFSKIDPEILKTLPPLDPAQVHQFSNLDLSDANSSMDSMQRTKSEALKDINIAPKSQIPKGSEIITFDLDETLISCNKLTNAMKKAGQKLGYKLYKSKEGSEFFVRPGAEELLKWIKDQGFKIVVSSRNFEKYEDDILASCGLGQYVDYTTGHMDLVESAKAADKKKFPNHPNNKLGILTWSGRVTHSVFKGIFKDTLWRGFKHYVLRDQNIKPYFPVAAWRNNKYPPYLSGSRVLIDNLYEETLINSKASEDWVALNPGEFYGDKEEPKNKDGEYTWVANIKKGLNIQKNQGWKALYEREYHKKPIDDKVPLAEQAKAEPKIKV